MTIFIICPNNLALKPKFQHPPCCPGGPEQHLFTNLCQDHDGLVALESPHLPFLSPEYSQATLFSQTRFRLYPIISSRSCWLIWLAPEK